MVIKWTGKLSCLLLTGFCSLIISSAALGEIILEYVTPTPESSPTDLAFDSAGNLWFTEWNGNRIGKLIPSEAKSLTTEGIIEYELPRPNSKPHYLTIATNGFIWFTEGANRIGRLDPKTGDIAEYDIPTPHSGPSGIAEGPDGSIWFLEFQTNKIGRLEPVSGRITEYPLGPGNPRDLVIKKGLIWYTQGGIPYVNIYISKLGTLEIITGNITSFKISPDNSVPYGITLNEENGDIWFTEKGSGKLARLDEKSSKPKILEYLVGKERSPHDLHIHQKQVWFTVSNPAAIGFLDLTRARPGTGQGVRFYKLPKPDSHPTQITLDKDGHIWFTLTGEFSAGKYNNRIGKLIP